MKWFLVIMLFALLVCLVILCHAYHEKRIERLESIVGFETPAAASWTNGHTYMTVVKHSANCPCVKK